MHVDPLAITLIAALASLLTGGIIWFLVMIHNDLRSVKNDLATLLQTLPLDYLRKADYSDDERVNREATRHIHRRIDAVRDGTKEPRGNGGNQ
jgi:hypothetical protein